MGKTKIEIPKEKIAEAHWYSATTMPSINHRLNLPDTNTCLFDT